MTSINNNDFPKYFSELVGFPPFDYQVKSEALISAGRHVVLRAPTGAGKTLAVVVPFLFSLEKGGPSKLIYALPLRTLVNSIFEEVRNLAERLGKPVDAQMDAHGREVVSPFVTIQTGEQPDDRFFDRGRVIMTTYDQVLSGLLHGPYGLSGRLHNINSASIAGSLLVFDEFHLMEPSRAFLTATAMVKLFGGLCQTVWMTATATTPLENVLQECLKAELLPRSEEDRRQLLNSLPSVSRVKRWFVHHHEPLHAVEILSAHKTRSIAVVNTVTRAQALYADLKELVGPEIEVVLLHSKFFQNHRRQKERALRLLFGKDSKAPAILIATQVVEAGVDISCEHLHTEICPMNALIQRAGRCARFPDEEGTVHIYELPAGERAWLPYGGLHSEEPTLSRTRDLLEAYGSGLLDMSLIASWIEEVHGSADEHSVRTGCELRIAECLSKIKNNALLRNPVRIADLIRGDDTDTVRLILATPDMLPDSPARCEALSISRRSLQRLLRQFSSPVGWVWSDSGWSSIASNRDVSTAYVVCLPPEHASYDEAIGLRLGASGTAISPPRLPPPNPGYSPLRSEAWVTHALMVAKETERRLGKEGLFEARLWRGFEEPPFGITVDSVSQAARTAALLHDLGKLQDKWQRWAESAQRSRDPNYCHSLPLAHTDFDPSSKEDRLREQQLEFRRPHHAAAGAYYAGAFLGHLLSPVPIDSRTHLASACAAAILAHHGGWLPPNTNLNESVTPLCKDWKDALGKIAFQKSNITDIKLLPETQDKSGRLQNLLDPTCSADTMQRWWPVVAFLTRTLRLSDQRATAEGAVHE